ncbi:hypothetical protein PG996_013124 [Apiospora saccharicola]|uniref:Uncharacterized protein n=1 Tax=Apiospora saccharicola TaxID=335842 RepID=A0ABR1U7A7_9PEZI
MSSLLGSLCHATGERAIHIRAHRRRVGFVPPATTGPQSPGPEAGNVVVMTTIHGLSQRGLGRQLRISASDFPREMARMLTGYLNCRGSVVEDPISGPVVYLEGDWRFDAGSWLAYGQGGPWLKPARIKVRGFVEDEWGFNEGRFWRDRWPWVRNRWDSKVGLVKEQAGCMGET